MWAPKEIALFSTCICSFGKRFDLFTEFVSSLISISLPLRLFTFHCDPLVLKGLHQRLNWS